MLQLFLIGRIGANATLQNKDGREFTTFRVAHNDDWVDQAGVKHSNTMWIDCIINGKPNVLPYLTAGSLVACYGSLSLRVYSSAKDRCMKAGATINVQRVELLGGTADPVPSRLYDEQGVEHRVQKYYCVDVENCVLRSQRGDEFKVVENGWVTQPTQAQEPEQTQTDNVPTT